MKVCITGVSMIFMDVILAMAFGVVYLESLALVLALPLVNHLTIQLLEAYTLRNHFLLVYFNQ